MFVQKCVSSRHAIYGHEILLLARVQKTLYAAVLIREFGSNIPKYMVSHDWNLSQLEHCLKSNSIETTAFVWSEWIASKARSIRSKFGISNSLRVTNNPDKFMINTVGLLFTYGYMILAFGSNLQCEILLKCACMLWQESVWFGVCNWRQSAFENTRLSAQIVEF